jgi:Xaa-Pro aminopeptidase
LLHGLDIAASSPWVYVERWQAEPYEERLKPGMIVVLKPNAITPDGGWGVRVSRTYAITEQGHQRLADYPLELTATSHA